MNSSAKKDGMLVRLQRIKGSHHIFSREDVQDILNIQPDGMNAKPYQVKQVRSFNLRYRLAGEEQ